MAINLSIDNNLLYEAQKDGGQKNQKNMVPEALKEYIQRRKQIDLYLSHPFTPSLFIFFFFMLDD